jgi:prepilin-type N-terminal cleavage/methylation domain-containing protein
VRLRTSPTCAQRLREQDGLTLVELLVAMLLLTIVIGCTLTALDSLSRAAPAVEESSHTVANARTTLYRITRELRQAASVTLVTGNVASADVAVAGVVKHVLYECDLNNRCTRKSTAAPAAAPTRGPTGGELLIANVQNVALGVPVFTTPSAKYFQVQLKVRTAGSLNTQHNHVLTYTDGFFARNM